VRVTLGSGSLALHWGGYDRPLRRLHYDTFQVDEKDEAGASPLAGELAMFSLNADGQPEVLHFLGRKFKRTAAKTRGG
jgi:hypothetical protein